MVSGGRPLERVGANVKRHGQSRGAGFRLSLPPCSLCAADQAAAAQYPCDQSRQVRFRSRAVSDRKSEQNYSIANADDCSLSFMLADAELHVHVID